MQHGSPMTSLPQSKTRDIIIGKSTTSYRQMLGPTTKLT